MDSEREPSDSKSTSQHLSRWRGEWPVVASVTEVCDINELRERPGNSLRNYTYHLPPLTRKHTLTIVLH